MEHTSTKWLLEKAFSVINPQKSQQSFDRKLTFCKMKTSYVVANFGFVWSDEGEGAGHGEPGHTLSGGQPLVLFGISHKLNS